MSSLGTGKATPKLLHKLKLYSSSATDSFLRSVPYRQSIDCHGQIKEVRRLSIRAEYRSNSLFSHTNHNQIKKAHRNGIQKPQRTRTRSLKGVSIYNACL